MHVRWKRKLRFKISFKKETLNLVLTRINPNELNDLQLIYNNPSLLPRHRLQSWTASFDRPEAEKLGFLPLHLDFPLFLEQAGRGNGSGATVCPFTGRNEGFSGRKWGHTGSFFLVFASAIRFRSTVHGDGGYRRRNDRRIGTLSMRFTREQSRGRGGWGRRSFRSSRVRSIYQTPRKLNRRVSLKTGRSKTRAIFVELSVARFLEQANSIFSRPRFNRE